MTEEQQGSQQQSATPKETRKTNIHEMRNQDYVSRLLAATPPYLYSAPVGPNNFFFSDMLRSLVQAKNNENARNIQLQQAAMSRRPRKRSWSQHRPYYEHLKERKEMEEKSSASIIIPEKPLELTTSKQLYPIASKYSRNITTSETSKDNSNNSHLKIPSTQSRQTPSPLNQQLSPPANNKLVEFHQTIRNENSPLNQIAMTDPPALSPAPTTTVPQPPPPVWYHPTLYPPYGIDPLHFFIDLRVSGHIYDRKKDNPSPLAMTSDNNNTTTSATSNGEGIVKHRHGSAFTVPASRKESKTAAAINLTTAACNNNSSDQENLDRIENYRKFYDLGESKENLPNVTKTTNYMLQNLPRLYTQFNARDSDDKIDESLDDTNESSHVDVELNNESPDEEDVIHQID